MQQEDGNLSQTFPKTERISSRLTIEQLVNSRKAVYKYPIKCYYAVNQMSDALSVSRMAVSVPKRLFKHAVDRNRIKRLVREAYRLNKEVLRSVVADGTSLAVALIWLADEPMESHRVTKSMKTILHRLAERQVGKKTDRQVDKKTERP